MEFDDKLFYLTIYIYRISYESSKNRCNHYLSKGTVGE